VSDGGSVPCFCHRCGDGIVCDGIGCTTGFGGGPEQCDDGNTNNNDLCSNDCRITDIDCGEVDSGPCQITVSGISGTFDKLQTAVDRAANGTATTPTRIFVRGVCAGITLINGRSNLLIEGEVANQCPPGPGDLRSTLKGGPQFTPLSGSKGEVVKVISSRNIAVRYLNIVDGGDHDGLEFKSSTAGTGDCNCVKRNDEGYELDGGTGHTLKNSLVAENDSGIRGHAGVLNSTISGNISESNAVYGIALLDSETEQNTVSMNTVRSNGLDCINLNEADFNKVLKNIVGGTGINCGRDPIRIENDADSNMVSDNVDAASNLIRVNCSLTSSNSNTGNNCQ
jgi:hypothetical protein